MLRRIVLILGILVLSAAIVSPAFAEPKVPTPKGKAFRGVIKSINSSTEWTIDTPADADSTVNVADAKVHWPHMKNATLEDFKVGDHVAIKLQGGPKQSGVLQARAVHLIPGKTIVHFTGEVTAKNGNDLTVKNGKGEAKTFHTNDSTKVRLGKDVKTINDVATGDKVTVVARASDDTALAIVIHREDAD